jgi:chromosomal replication initiator protein
MGEVIVTTATSSSDIGARIADRLNRTLGPKKYAMWFDRSARFELDDQAHELRVTVANKFLADGIGRQFRRQVCEAARDELGHDVSLDLGVRPVSAPRQDEHPGSHPATQTVGDARPGRRPADNAPRAPRRAKQWRYTLDDFVVGPSNQLAFAAATQLADLDQDPGSPLFIHGTCGLGKTHLIQGICQRVNAMRPDAKVRYTTGEQFTNDYIAAVRTNTLDAFRRKIRRLDLLAVDDVHFIANKEKTQQEFLHCFNEIELSGARVVMVSDCHPKLIKQFSDALTSRCVRGMVVRIDPPDADTRLRLVEALAERRGLAIPQTVAQTITQRCGGSVRDIEGVLNKLQALSMIQRTGRQHPGFAPVIGHSLLDQLFQDQPAPSPRKPVRFNAVLDAVCELFALPPEQVTGRMRKTHVVLARSLLIHLAYELTHMSYPELAAAMGRPNHSTIITAAQRIKKQLKADKPVLLPGQPGETTPSRLLEQLTQMVQRSGSATATHSA